MYFSPLSTSFSVLQTASPSMAHSPPIIPANHRRKSTSPKRLASRSGPRRRNAFSLSGLSSRGYIDAVDQSRTIPMRTTVPPVAASSKPCVTNTSTSSSSSRLPDSAPPPSSSKSSNPQIDELEVVEDTPMSSPPQPPGLQSNKSNSDQNGGVEVIEETQDIPGNANFGSGTESAEQPEVIADTPLDDSAGNAVVSI